MKIDVMPMRVYCISPEKLLCVRIHLVVSMQLRGSLFDCGGAALCSWKFPAG
jgi:hypothetical protein